MVIEKAVASNIVAQIGSLIGTEKWPLDPPSANTMRGIDFYPTADFVRALVLCAQGFKAAHGYLPLLASPTSFNEHIFARKFLSPLPMPSLADKLLAQEHVRARLGADLLPTVVWVGEDVAELFTAKLPSGRFVLKANNGSGTNLFLDLPGDLTTRREEIEKRATEWLLSRFGYDTGEWQYCTFKPKLFLEGFLNFGGGRALDEYKFHCFRGKVRLIKLIVDRFTRARGAFHDPSWKYFPVLTTQEPIERPRPRNLDDMIRVAETLAEGMEFVRIDLFSDQRSIKFSEFTYTPGNANTIYSDFKFDRWLGGHFAKSAA